MTETDRVNRFEAAYNRISKSLDDLVGRHDSGKRRTFAARIRHAANRMRRLGKHVDFLLEIGELRNAIVHNRFGDGTYIAVPSEETVLKLEEIDKLIRSPETVGQRFERAVKSLDADSTLADAWALMRDSGHSRFPVYDRGGFIGLLTSNGIARWLAAEVKGGRLDVDGGSIAVRDILPVDRRRDLAAFVAADTPIDDVAELFRENTRLEAVIMTRHGRSNEPPLGLIGPGDLLGR